MYSYFITHSNESITEIENVSGFYTKDGLLLLTSSTGTVSHMIAVCNIIAIQITENNQTDTQEQE